ncbi:MAG: TonB family protein [Sphingomonas sp.]|uniref:energy transducer TonB n=1 Tax=Sphingomonas sp. TaxID=28214 RepID=UPI00120986D0|nr:energy transducer TonB [Sphingomonas sp.]THD36816.1 MAG: TonB family protein [Sphingomonas sp.]
MIASLFAALLASQGAAAPLPPAGKWTVEYQKDMCIVSRPFGPAEAPIIFALKPAVSMEETGQALYVVAPNAGGNGGYRQGHATISLDPPKESRKVDFTSWIPARGKVRTYQVYADADMVKAMDDTASVLITAGNEHFWFDTGKMRAVLKAMRACNEDLIRSWGVDPATMARTLPGSNAASWFPQDSYPASAKRRGAQGRSVIVITVSPEGTPTACRAVVNAAPDLDETTCRLAMRNARFEPSTGTTVRYGVLGVRWELWDF